MDGFVRVADHACAKWGIGKLIDSEDAEVTISWFNSPLSEPRVETIARAHVVPVVLERQTRVYWLDRSVDTWRVGRILDADNIRAEVRFPNRSDHVLPISELEVRWDFAIDDPSAFLAAKINESPQFAQARTRFTRSLIAQRGACSGMSGLISSTIDLEQHQYEVVKRVLQDPVQRYLLADEVGLGKTIEAGVLIRQHVLDNPQNHQIFVIVPPDLVVQWRRELRKRFLLGDLLDDSLHVAAMNASPQQLLETLRVSSMVVIDEAHHLSRDSDLYTLLREAIIAVPRLLLLSATPVLHNERGFLEMLHLLDPHVYRLEEETAFRQRIEHRQALAESVAGLVPENLLQIEDFVDDLTNRFPDDALLHEHAESLRNIVMELPDESDPQFKGALTRLRAHLTETYRLDRRILRNRRRDLPLLTPHRAGVKRIDYSSASIARLIQAVEDWRTSAAEAVSAWESGEYAVAEWFRELLETVLTDATKVAKLVRDRIERLDDTLTSAQWEQEPLAELLAVAKLCTSDDERLTALQRLVDSQLQGDAKILVFCSRPSVADAVTEALQRTLSVPVDRYVPHGDPEDDSTEQHWERFLSASTHRVLVCDAVAEEGHNFQGGAKVIIHFDLPLSPNRVEQRLGRVDRYGAGDAIRSFALCCSDDPYAGAWLSYLGQGLGLFNRSVASLQYLIEEEMFALASALLVEGVDALNSLAERTGGAGGRAEGELRRIDDQDALDALTISDEESQFDTLTDIDSDWRDITESMQQWMIDTLQIQYEDAPTTHRTPLGFGTFRFCFSYSDHGSNTLIPRNRILSTLLQVLDPEAGGAHSRLLKTGWYSCRRGTTLGSPSSAEGVRLVRWGEALVERIQKTTDLDDRGRAAAMWRHCRGYNLRSYASADLFLRFDFIVETDVHEALGTAENSRNPSLQKALERRGDMALAPFYKTIWIDEDLSLVTNRDLVELLEAPYQKAPTEGVYQDWNLNSERWSLLNPLGLPVIDAWRHWVPEAREAAERLLRNETALEQLCQESSERVIEQDEGRFAQLLARIRHADPATAQATKTLLAKEERISEALYSAIREPRITLATVVANFVSPHALPMLSADNE